MDAGAAGGGAGSAPGCWIYLLRHGATAANRATPYRLQGRAQDLDLDPVGREQARRAALALASIPLDAVYTSPMRRAVQTADAIAAPRGLRPATLLALVEADVGAWEGLTWDEARARHPEDYANFMANPGVAPYRDGESFLDVQRRVAPAMAELARRHPAGRVAVVAHNVVNRAYLALLLGVPIALARTLPQNNGGINVIHHPPDAPPDALPKIVTLNAALHLEGIADGR